MSILELGFGYNRLLDSLLKLDFPFKYYSGIDISEFNVDNAWRISISPRIRFILGDFNEVEFDETYDLVISSLTLKHQYPSFEQTLNNIKNYMNENAIIIFDLLEGDSEKNRWEVKNEYQNYLAFYSREEILNVLQATGFGLIKFDYVFHQLSIRRLLVIAQRMY